jgi:hypothetical protein
MSLPRRQIIRLAAATRTANPDRQLRLQRLHSRLEQERRFLRKWMARLRRAFHAVEKLQLRISRIERTITRQEN